MLTTDLADRTDDDVGALHARYAATGDRHLRNELLAHYDSLAVRLARACSSKREDPADLVQVARIGLILALDRFDPGRERPFTAFARATILGELKRHIRDHTWPMRVPRTLKEHYLVVCRVSDDLIQELRRPPLIAEIAARAGLKKDDVREVLRLDQATAFAWIDGAIDHDSLADLSADDPRLRHLENRQAIATVVARLTERERETLRLRFEQGLSQTDIAAQLGVTQMSISRELARSFRRLRARLTDL